MKFCFRKLNFFSLFSDKVKEETERMGSSKGPQPRYLVAVGVIFLVFMPIFLQCCIDYVYTGVYTRVKQQPLSVKFGIVWFIWATGLFIYW